MPPCSSRRHYIFAVVPLHALSLPLSWDPPKTVEARDGNSLLATFHKTLGATYRSHIYLPFTPTLLLACEAGCLCTGEQNTRQPRLGYSFHVSSIRCSARDHMSVFGVAVADNLAIYLLLSDGSSKLPKRACLLAYLRSLPFKPLGTASLCARLAYLQEMKKKFPAIASASGAAPIP